MSCGRCGQADEHTWVEGDCTLQHRTHSTRLLEGSFVCEPCVDRWDEWLAEIVDLYAGLAEVLLPGSIPDNTAEHKRPKKAPASPSPIRLEAWALLHPEHLNDHIIDQDGTERAAYLGNNLPDIPAVLCGWAEFYSTTSTVSGSVAALRANRDRIARDPDADTFDAEIRWVRRALRNAHGLANPMPICPCITVGCNGNVWPKPGTEPRCDRCNRRYGSLDLVRARVNNEQVAS